MSFALSPEQRQAVEARGPVCVTASAGSGKTAVLVERYAAALEQGLTPDQILTVTFTRKAGQQLRDRLIARLKDAPDETREGVLNSPWIGTLHGFCLQVVRQWARLLPDAPQGTVLEPLERAAWVPATQRAWMRALPLALQEQLFEFWTPQDLGEIAREALNRPHDCRASLAREADGIPGRLLAQALLPLLDDWQRRLRAQERLTFDELENAARVLLRDHPAPRKHYQDRFGLILVDEFQDTSPAQWEILEALSAPDPRRLFVVGDPKQSIYRFRQADVSLFLRLRESLSETGGEGVELNTCYRSRPRLVEKFNALSEQIFGSGLSAITSGRAEVHGDPALGILAFPGGTAAETLETERALIADHIAQRIAQGTPPHEIALLFRAGERMQAFGEALSDRKIPIFCEPVQRLFSFYEIRDISNYLRALHDPADDFALAAWLTSPYGAFSTEQIDSLRKPGRTLMDALREKELLRWLTTLLDSGALSPAACLEALFTHTTHWPARAEVFFRLLEGLAPCTTLAQAVELMDLWEKEEVAVSAPLGNTSPHGVRLLTVHASKGLEFEEVYLVDTQRKPPTHRTWLVWNAQGQMGVRFRQDGEIRQSPVYDALAPREIEDDRAEAGRILYVAMTRAKNQLWVSLAQSKSAPPGSWAAVFTAAK